MREKPSVFWPFAHCSAVLVDRHWAALMFWLFRRNDRPLARKLRAHYLAVNGRAGGAR